MIFGDSSQKLQNNDKQKGIFIMKITLDLDTNQIVVPKTFFKTIEKQNDLIRKMGGAPIKPMELIQASFTTAMSDTDKFLRTKE